MADARDLRLQADYEHLKDLARQSGGAIKIESTFGRPPDQYVLVVNCRSIQAIDKDKPIYRDSHQIRITLPARYPAPSAPPLVEMLTPIFHPHVYPNQTVCIGSWSTAEYLEDFVMRMGALLQFDRQYINMKDPANPEAMSWVMRNLLLLPTDNMTFLAESPSPPSTPSAQEGLLDWKEIDSK